MIAMNIPEFKMLFPFLQEDRFIRRILFEYVKQPFINPLTVNIKINNNNTTIHFKEKEEKERLR